MPEQIEAEQLDVLKVKVSVDLPDRCPRCHSKVYPLRLTPVLAPDERDLTVVEVAFRCPNRDCQRLFIAIYEQDPDKPAISPFELDLVGLRPVDYESPPVPQAVSGLSVGFYETYSQATAAEALGLDQLTGIGLRKALEFLVKDFAVSRQPDDSADIEKKPLAACIKDYIDDPNAQAAAKRATWLGNDETHYDRRWIDKDIEDLKVLVRVTVNWIENLLLTEQYRDEMPEDTEREPGPAPAR